MMDSYSEGLSRRNFLRISVGAAAGLAVLNMPHVSFASENKVTVMKFADCPALPQDIVKKSQMVNAGWKKLLEAANSISDKTIGKKIKNILYNPAPTFMQQYSSSADMEQVYNKLLDKGLVNSTKISAKMLFPPLKSSQQAPQPFITAPGSGYDSHHAYPGGLVMHTLNNVTILQGICNSYKHVFFYDVNYDIAVAGELLHDIGKPWVFQWKNNGESLTEMTIAKTGAHHIFSIAESIYRDFPSDIIVALACAHENPGTAAGESLVIGWIKAAALMAGKDPVKIGLLDNGGRTLPMPHKQEGFIVHLGDHDYVLSGPASQKSVIILKKIAVKEYGIRPDNAVEFNKFRNYIGSQVSFMHIYHTMSQGGNPYQNVLGLVKKIIL
ncbi:TAT (twin-arginine translocation) pathway signal sequence [Pectinatus sottacetonis]|uniref:TAT (twin-arginine translocation) pathway signal sequence n=1 Tax=Pectinatus sottacetonis TaxID=1002795 RepID=UPI0018C69379|nr:TAT (twin-arginine translocation) pathway signal sequence [Pectinatus sottacetonis]